MRLLVLIFAMLSQVALASYDRPYLQSLELEHYLIELSEMSDSRKTIEILSLKAQMHALCNLSAIAVVGTAIADSVPLVGQAGSSIAQDLLTEGREGMNLDSDAKFGAMLFGALSPFADLPIMALDFLRDGRIDDNERWERYQKPFELTRHVYVETYAVYNYLLNSHESACGQSRVNVILAEVVSNKRKLEWAVDQGVCTRELMDSRCGASPSYKAGVCLIQNYLKRNIRMGAQCLTGLGLAKPL